MAEGRKLKTEHVGAKNGGGYWGRRAEAKHVSNRKRRQHDHAEVREFWFGPGPPDPVLRKLMDEVLDSMQDDLNDA